MTVEYALVEEELGHGWWGFSPVGYGLGLAMGAKLAAPDMLCTNVWGDAAIGFTGMEFEAAMRERIPILSVLLNKSSMAIELKVMKVATAKYRSTDISGNYADVAKALGGRGERGTEAGAIIPALKRAIASTRDGTPALLEFITEKAEDFSLFPSSKTKDNCGADREDGRENGPAKRAGFVRADGSGALRQRRCRGSGGGSAKAGGPARLPDGERHAEPRNR